jgi:hypothetical protein
MGRTLSWPLLNELNLPSLGNQVHSLNKTQFLAFVDQVEKNIEISTHLNIVYASLCAGTLMLGSLNGSWIPSTIYVRGFYELESYVQTVSRAPGGW